MTIALQDSLVKRWSRSKLFANVKWGGGISVVCAFMERKHIKGHVSSTDNWIYLPHVLYLPRILSIMFAFAMHVC